MTVYECPEPMFTPEHARSIGVLRVPVERLEESYQNAVTDVYQPKICLSVIGSAFEVQRSGRQTCAIFVGEDVKTQAGPDLKALIASHKQQAAYIDALHEKLRELVGPSTRPVTGSYASQAVPGPGGMPVMMGGGVPGPMGGSMGQGKPIASTAAPFHG